jgi:hypothetical protein
MTPRHTLATYGGSFFAFFCFFLFALPPAEPYIHRFIVLNYKGQDRNLAAGAEISVDGRNRFHACGQGITVPTDAVSYRGGSGQEGLLL